MKIIGSSKIDDYKKTVLEDSVLRAINAKPGDSVLFYKKQNDSNVCIYRAEGAQISNETDTPMRNHLRGAFDKLRMILLATAVMSVLSLFVIALNFGSISVVWFAVGLIASILAIAGAVASIHISQSVDPAFDSQELVTVGGPYSQNRLTGLSRLTSDGYVVSGDLYINTLFGASPSAVDVDISLDGYETFKALVKCTKSVPGYSLYKVRFKEEAPVPGSFVVKTTYRYSGKTVTVYSTFIMEVYEESKEIKVIEGKVDAKLEFDEKIFNSTEFDDILFNPSDDN